MNKWQSEMSMNEAKTGGGCRPSTGSSRSEGLLGDHDEKGSAMSEELGRMAGVQGLLRMARMVALALVFLSAGVFSASEALAAVSNTSQWAIVGSSATTLQTITPLARAKGTGSNRLLVVTVLGDAGIAFTTFQPTVTYGGQTLTRITSIDTTSRQKLWIGYLNEAGIAAATGATPVFTVSAVAGVTTGASLSAAFYQDVLQSAPITASRAIASDTAATTPTSAAIATVNGGWAIYAINTNAATAVNASVPAGYTEHFDTANGTLYMFTMGSGTMTGTTTNPLPVWTLVRYGFLTASLAPAPIGGTTTLADGTNPTPVATLAPGATATNLDAFTLQGTIADTVTAATVSLLPANAFNNIGLVELTNAAGNVVYGTVASPASNTVSFTGMTLPVTTGAVTFYVRVTPKTAALMPAVPGASYATTGTVTAITCTNTVAGTDTASNTLTIDNASPANPTLFVGTAGNNQVALTWTNPGADFNSVVILRRTAAIADVPVEGATYVATNTIGGSTVVYAGPLALYTDAASNGTGYFYKIFAKDAYGNYSSGGMAAGPYTPTGPTTTIGNGTAPGNLYLKPSDPVNDLDYFTVQTSTGTETITGVTLSLTGGGGAPNAFSGIGQITITDAANTVLGTLNNPVSDTPTIVLTTNITASTTSTQYKVRITPKTHVNMPAPPGVLYTISGTVSAVTSTNAKVYSDISSGIIEIDNASTDVATWGVITPDNTIIDLSWANPTDPDLDGTNSVVVLRKGGSAVTEVPVEGVSYIVGNTIGGATVRYVGPVEGFIDSPLTNFANYYYAVFAKDTNGNYSTGSTTGPHQPWVPVCVANTPTLTINPGARNAIPTDVAKYTISVKNNDNALCAAQNFTLSLGDSNSTDFVTPSVLSATVLNIAPGATKQSTLTVTVNGLAPLGNINVTTINLTAAGHSSPPAVTATTTAANPLMHNSRVTGSTKWQAQGGWGVTGGKYGTFNCYICHESSVFGANGTPNVKKVRTTIVMPVDAPGGDNWPTGGKTTPTITFDDTRAGSSSYADANSAHATSTRVCEVCHTYQGGAEPNNSGVRNHAYNMSTATAQEQAHNSLGDCLSCHPHQGGFKAQGCTSCHGNPLTIPAHLSISPVTGSSSVGAHPKHQTEAFNCDYCHGAGSTAAGGGALHAAGAIYIEFTGFGQAEGSDGTYKGALVANRPFGYLGNDLGTADGSLSCATTYCHGGTMYPALPAPTWTGAAACGSCHNDTAADASWRGSHADHLSATGANLNCNVCHGAGYAAGTTKPVGHLNGQVKIDLGAYGTYTKVANGGQVPTVGLPAATAYGSCTVTCHGAAQTPVWGTDFGVAPAKCTKCHNDGTAGALLVNSVPSATKNAHVVHINANNSYVTNDCAACHGANAQIGTHTGHANGTATYGNQLSGYSTANKNCTNTCHVSSTTNLWIATPPALACADCHSSTYIGGNNVAMGFNAIPTTGLHNISAAGVTKHDATLPGGGCAACHVTEDATNHMNGAFVADSLTNNDRWVNRTTGGVMTYTQITPASGNSGTCSGAGLTGCHSDAGNWYRRWSQEANIADTVTTVGNTKCNVCHGQWNSWAQGTTHYKTSNSAASTKGNGHDSPVDCAKCHAYLHANYGALHDSATHRVTINSNGALYARNGAVYGTSKAGCSQCHDGATNATYNFDISYFTEETVLGDPIPMPPCNSCHDNAAKVATVPQVFIRTTANSSSSHVDADGGGATYTINVAGSNAQCENCHAGHWTNAQVDAKNDIGISTISTRVVVPGGPDTGTLIPTMNKQYAAHDSMIRLGGTATATQGKEVLASAGAITFTATQITRANGLDLFVVGDAIRVFGSTSNNRTFIVTAATAAALTVTPAPTVEASSTTEILTTRGTEAQLCWNCHATVGISEWGANTKPATGNSPYNYGAVTSPNWTTATWSSSRTQFAYKTGAIQSTHTANPDVTDAALGGAAYTRTETKNSVEQIRCTSCHDVHELGMAVGDKKEGKPYLRGSWMGNPYEEDGAPRSVYANTTYFTSFVFNTEDVTNIAVTRTYGWGAVPRGSKNQAKLGGYWIDQNNVRPMTALTTGVGTAALNPTATWEPLDTNAEAGNSGATSPAFAGLCLLCHGTGVVGTALKIDGLDQKTAEAIWMGTNGHANSVKGGTGSASASSFNVFDARTGVATLGHVPRQHYAGMVEPGDSSGFGFRGNTSDGGLGYTPLLTNARAYGYIHDDWKVDDTGATKESAYHKFSCSKCHNPHASRLPKLMITNCLDTVHNTWDNAFQLNPQAGNNQNKELAQWTSAQNCHRYSQSNNATTTTPEYRASRTAGAAGTGAGWNKVTPWLQTTTTP